MGFFLKKLTRLAGRKTGGWRGKMEEKGGVIRGAF
jgi:hypothetical protein